jgi:ATP-dependent DNA ligase
VAQPASRFVLDGEIVIAGDDGLEFESLLLRIHPAASRVAKLAGEMPASFVAFDLLADGDADLRDVPLAERRAALERLLVDAPASVLLTPATTDAALAQRWFEVFEGAGLDGVVAKREDLRYLPGERAMSKIKHLRSADCVVAGFRWHKNGPGTMVGSLLLGLWNDAGQLQHVGVTSSFTMDKRRELVEFLEPYRANALEGHPWQGWKEFEAQFEGKRMPGAGSRWNRGKDLSWEPLRPELVAEVSYEHMQGARFRHTAHFRRWRPERTPESCTYDQLERPLGYDLDDILAR